LERFLIRKRCQIFGTKKKQNLSLNQDKISKDESWDGFYGIQCSKIELGIDEVLNTCRILKSSLQSRPVFHWSEKRIRGHLVICFIAFLLQRILELRLIEYGYEHTSEIFNT